MFINYQTEQIGQEDSGGYSAYAGKPAEGYVKFVEVSATLVSKTVTVNGVVFTAVASGATGDQFNVAVGDETQTASNLQQAINNSVSGGVSNLTAAADAYGDGLLRIYTNTVGDSGSSYTLATNYNTEVKLFGANFADGVPAIPFGVTGVSSGCQVFSEDCGIAESTNSTILQSPASFIYGANEASSIIGGLHNLIMYGDANTIVGGFQNDISPGNTGSFNAIVGGTNNVIKSVSGQATTNSTILAGTDNIIIGDDQNTMLGCDTARMQCGGWSGMVNCWQSANISTSYNNYMIGADQSYISGSNSNYNLIGPGGDNEITGGSSLATILSADQTWLDDSYYCIVAGFGNRSTGSSYNGLCVGEECTIDVSNYAYTFGRYAVVDQSDYAITLAEASTNKRLQTRKMVTNTTLPTANTSVVVGVGGQATGLEISRNAWNGTALALKNYCAYGVVIRMAAVQTAGTAGTLGDTCISEYRLAVKNVSGTVTVINDTESQIGYDTNAVSWGLTFGTSGEFLTITFGGEVDKQIDVNLVLEINELALL